MKPCFQFFHVYCLILMTSFLCNPNGIRAQYIGNGVLLGHEFYASSNTTKGVKLRQRINEKEFEEYAFVDYSSFKSLKLIYNPLVLIRDGVFNWTGLEVGFGLNGSQSEIRASRNSSLNGQVFDFYQMGDLLSLNEYGVSLHSDVFFSLFFAGCDVDAGLLTLRATNSMDSQLAKGWGGYFSPKFRFGMCLPLVGGLTDTKFKLYWRYFVQLAPTTMLVKNIDWTATGRELKNFTTLDANNTIINLGMSLSMMLEN